MQQTPGQDCLRLPPSVLPRRESCGPRGRLTTSHRPCSPIPSNFQDALFLFEPSLSAEIRLARIVRLGLGVGYRYVGAIDTPGLNDADLRGITGMASLRLGWF
jgi:hypothetical protein